MRVCHDHNIPFRRDPRSGKPNDLADVPGHIAGGAEIELDIQAVLLVERRGKSLSALRAKSGRTVKLDDAFFLGAGDKIVERRSFSKLTPRGANDRAVNTRIKLL